MYTNPLTPFEVKQGVEAFDARFAEMERALWSLSRAATDAILARKRSQVTEVFVWTIKSWWGIQGVRRETKTIAADVLLELTWTNGGWRQRPQSTPMVSRLQSSW